MYNFSIIIPHKNIPELLERCLASIPQRDDTQIIIIDDSSDPGIVNFARFPGKGRPHTEVVFHKSPIGGAGGSGYARNRGLDVARGKWLVFADADDFFHTAAMNEAMDRHLDAQADIVFFRHDSVESSTLEPVSINSRRNKMLAEFDRTSTSTGTGSGTADDNIRYKIQVPWGKFIRRQLIITHDIRFDEVRFSSNVLFAVKTGYFAEGILSDPAVIYCNVRRAGSLIHEGRRDWEAMSVRFDADYRAALFASSVEKGRLLEHVVAERWRELAVIDRKKARKLLPRLREVCSPRTIRGVKLKILLKNCLKFPIS